jgi:hypothetical protein
MIARWQMHRYLLRQSLSFFSNEFAGRVATKVMQTSLSIREAVMKLLDVFVYVSVYFIAMIGMVASADWRLVLPLLVWLAVYVGLIALFRAEAQADLRRSGRCPFGDDRPGGRQLHQHLDGQAVLPCGPGGGLRAGKHGHVPRDRAPADAAGDAVPDADLSQQFGPGVSRFR